MVHIPYIILFILCSAASGYLINRVYMRFEKNRPSGKSPGGKDHFKMSEENYRSIIDNMQDVFYRTDLEGKLIMASPSIKRLLWHDLPEEYTGMNVAENFYYNPSDRKVLMDMLRKDGAVADFETILRRKDGSLLTASISSRFYYDGDGKIAGVEGIVRDITGRKRAEELFRVAFHENPCPMSITEADTGRILEINNAWLNTFEYKLEEIKSKTVNEINVYSTQEDQDKVVQVLTKTGRVSGMELKLVTSTGKIITGLFFAELVKLGGNNVVFATLLDISELRRMERESVQNALVFRTIFEASPYSITINRVKDGAYLMVNPAFEKITGYSAEDVIGKHGYDLTLKKSKETAGSYVNEIMNKSRIDNAIIRTVTKFDEARYTMFSTRLIDFDGEPCFLSLTIDMTETHKIQEQLNHTQKMDAIGQLAGGVAHDFNNMLGGIMGAAELLHLNQDIPEKRARYINMIKSTAERAGELTAKLLAFSRKSEIELRPVDIHKAIDDTLELLHHSIDRRIDIRRELNAEYHVINGDMSQLMNIFLNLGINAGHAMPDGGTLTFSTRITDLDRTWCAINSPDLVPGSYIIVEVMDTGRGIPPENINRIFEPFFTTSEKGKGTGLGLPAVYGNVKQHHGAITVYSEPGRGTVFHMYLPLAVETAILPVNNDELIKGHGLVLVVDDEEIMRITAREILQMLGYDVIEAVNGREGVDIYQAEHGRIDAVLLDMVMPVMNGHECFRKLKEINPDVNVIIASGFMLDHNIEDMKTSGLKGFIRKPYKTSELSRTLAGVISGGNS